MIRIFFGLITLLRTILGDTLTTTLPAFDRADSGPAGIPCSTPEVSPDIPGLLPFCDPQID
jgi:hypothetical protein